MKAAVFVAIAVTAIALFLILESEGTALSFAELLALAQAAGFIGSDALTAAAIALAESGGNPKAYNPETAAGTPQGKGSYGLWQIYLKAHPEFEGQDLFDPPTNAAAAFKTFSDAGGSFTPWSTFNSGAFQKFIQGGSSA